MHGTLTNSCRRGMVLQSLPGKTKSRNKFQVWVIGKLVVSAIMADKVKRFLSGHGLRTSIALSITSIYQQAVEDVQSNWAGRAKSAEEWNLVWSLILWFFLCLPVTLKLNVFQAARVSPTLPPEKRWATAHSCNGTLLSCAPINQSVGSIIRFQKLNIY